MFCERDHKIDNSFCSPREKISFISESLLSNITRWLKPELNLPAKASIALDSAKRDLERQISSIETGEQAANAKLQAAIDTLQPAVYYHEYTRG